MRQHCRPPPPPHGPTTTTHTHTQKPPVSHAHTPCVVNEDWQADDRPRQTRGLGCLLNGVELQAGLHRTRTQATSCSCIHRDRVLAVLGSSSTRGNRPASPQPGTHLSPKHRGHDICVGHRLHSQVTHVCSLGGVDAVQGQLRAVLRSPNNRRATQSRVVPQSPTHRALDTPAAPPLPLPPVTHPLHT